MFWAVDLVQDRRTKQPFNTMKDKVGGNPMLVDKVAAAMMRGGVAVQSWISHLVVAPPLIIAEAEIDFGVAVMDEALSIADEKVKKAANNGG
jgi:taurine--2-oxoglutarate transaminase